MDAITASWSATCVAKSSRAFSRRLARSTALFFNTFSSQAATSGTEALSSKGVDHGRGYGSSPRPQAYWPNPTRRRTLKTQRRSTAKDDTRKRLGIYHGGFARRLSAIHLKEETSTLKLVLFPWRGAPFTKAASTSKTLKEVPSPTTEDSKMMGGANAHGRIHRVCYHHRCVSTSPPHP